MIHFSVSGVTVSPFVPFLVAFAISFFTSMGGVSGAFLLLPFQVSVLGFTSPAVSSTNQLYNVVAIPGGVLRYIREGRMAWPLAWVIIAGSLPGVVMGAAIRIWVLPDPTAFKVFVAVVLMAIGTRVLYRLFRGGAGTKGGRPPSEGKPSRGAIRTEEATLTRVVYVFGGSTYSFSTPAVFALALFSGLLGGAYGIGGGALTAPILVSLFGLPVYTISGPVLLGTFATSVGGVLSFLLLAPLAHGVGVAPDWGLGCLFGLGGMFGVYAGARCQRFVPEKPIQIMLGVVLIILAAKYLLPLVF